MKIKNLSILLLLSLFIFSSCSSDDDAGNADNNNENYYPLVVANNWDFKNTVSSPNQNDIVTTENLSVSGTVDNNGTEAYNLETDNPDGSGPVTTTLTQGVLFKNNSSLIYNGVFGLSLEGFPELNLNVENVIIYNSSSPSGTELFSQTGNVEQDFLGIPISVDFILSTEMGQSFVDFEVNGEVYDDVISSQLTVNIGVTTVANNDIPFPITVLQPQNAVVITNYFANEVGLIKSETDTNLSFEELPIPNIPLDDINFNTLQILTAFSVSLE